MIIVVSTKFTKEQISQIYTLNILRTLKKKKNLKKKKSPLTLPVKNPTANVRVLRDTGLILESRRSPEGGHWQPTPVFLPGESHGQNSLVGYSP